MGLELEIFFRANDLIKQIAKDGKIIVTAKTKQGVDGKLILEAYATIYDKDFNNPGEPIRACPTPCHPITDADCQQKTEDLFKVYFGD